jgi:hypothetical protein
MGQQLAEDAQLADAAGDQLRVLPAVVEDDDLVDGARRRDLADVLIDELGGSGRAGHDALAHHRGDRPADALPTTVERSHGVMRRG